VLATDGYFYNDAAFMVCPPPDTSELEKLFRYELFKMLKAEGKITDVIIYDMKNWRHSGFNVYCRSQNMSCQGGPQLNESATGSIQNPKSRRFQKPSQPLHGRFEDGHVGGVAEPQGSFAAVSEGHTGCQRDLGLFEQGYRKREGVLQTVDSWKQVKCSFRSGNRNPLDGAQSLKAKLGPLSQRGHHGLHEGFTLPQGSLPRALDHGGGMGDNELVELGGLFDQSDRDTTQPSLQPVMQ